jgi:hypothetical protein
MSPDEFGEGKRFATRREVFSGMSVGDIRSFAAESKAQYDALRGGIHSYARRSGKKFTASRSKGIVTVERKADDYVSVPLVMG